MEVCVIINQINLLKMKKFITAFAIVLCLASCSLQSTTTIKPNESFVLGNNQHEKFKVALKNVSQNNLEVYHAPINGGRHSSQTVMPDKKIKIRVDKNTAIVIDNKNNDTAKVELKVTGDLGLSMGYKYEQ